METTKFVNWVAKYPPPHYVAMNYVGTGSYVLACY